MGNPASILCVSLIASSCIQLLQLVSCMINPEVCVHFFYHVLFFYETTDFSKKKWFMNILLNEKMNLRKNKKKAGWVRIQLQSTVVWRNWLGWVKKRSSKLTETQKRNMSWLYLRYWVNYLSHLPYGPATASAITAATADASDVYKGSVFDRCYSILWEVSEEIEQLGWNTHKYTLSLRHWRTTIFKS